MLSPDEITAIVENATVSEAEDLIRALAEKNNFTLALVDRSWVAGEISSELSLRQHEVDSRQASSVASSMVDTVLEKIHDTYGDEMVEGMLEDRVQHQLSQAVKTTMEPVWGKGHDRGFVFAVELVGKGRELITLRSFSSFEAAHRWGEEQLGKSVHEVELDADESLEVVRPDLDFLPTAVVDEFRLHSTDEKGRSHQSFVVEDFDGFEGSDFLED